MIFANMFLHLVVYVIHYLLTCCTESERSAEYGKTYAWCILITSTMHSFSLDYPCTYAFHNKNNIGIFLTSYRFYSLENFIFKNIIYIYIFYYNNATKTYTR